MFIGHYAVGFASKRAAPRTSLGWLMAAPLFLDILWPLFVLAGIEHVRIAPGDTAFTPLAFDWYPWSHSLLMTLVWAALFAFLYWQRTHYGRGAAVLALGVLSHWVLDAISHRPDLPLAPGSGVRVGLGLWNAPTATMIVEIGMFVAAVWLYARTTHARDGVGRWGFVAFVLFLLAAYGADRFSPPPPSVDAIAYAAIALYVTPVWAGWFDRHRTA